MTIIILIFILINTLVSLTLCLFVYLLLKREYNSIKELVKEVHPTRIEEKVIQPSFWLWAQIILDSKLR